MTNYIVAIDSDAERDLDDIVNYIVEHGSIDRAIDVDKVVVVLIADGRRDMHALMSRRLLGA